jgi:hypothetical protein
LVTWAAAVQVAALVAGPAVVRVASAAVRVEQIASVAGICHVAAVETGAPLAEVEVDSMDPVHAATAAAAPPASDLEVEAEASDLEVEVEEALVAAAEGLAAEVPVVAVPVVVAAGADRGSNP